MDFCEGKEKKNKKKIGKIWLFSKDHFFSSKRSITYFEKPDKHWHSPWIALVEMWKNWLQSHFAKKSVLNQSFFSRQTPLWIPALVTKHRLVFSLDKNICAASVPAETRLFHWLACSSYTWCGVLDKLSWRRVLSPPQVHLSLSLSLSEREWSTWCRSRQVKYSPYFLIRSMWWLTGSAPDSCPKVLRSSPASSRPTAD